MSKDNCANKVKFCIQASMEQAIQSKSKNYSLGLGQHASLNKFWDPNYL